jgi:hypothetical protein
MNKQFENLFDSVELSRKWTFLTLGNVEQWVAMNFDYVQDSFQITNQQLKTAWAGLNEIHEPARWSAMSQAMTRHAIASTRELMCAATDYQIDVQQLFREQAAEAHKLVEASLNQQFSHLKSVEAEVGQADKAPSIARKLAA